MPRNALRFLFVASQATFLAAAAGPQSQVAARSAAGSYQADGDRIYGKAGPARMPIPALGGASGGDQPTVPPHELPALPAGRHGAGQPLKPALAR